MQQYIRLSSILSQMRMLYSNFKILSIVVEGYSDKQFLDQHMDHKSFYIKYLNGWESVIEFINYVNEEHVLCIKGLIDADYHRISKQTGHKYGELNNLIYTDFHDIEMMLFISNAFSKFLGICASSGKMEKCANAREVIMDAAKYIGALRLIGIELDLNLWFKDIDYERFISRQTLKLNVVQLIGYIYNRTCSHNGCSLLITKEQILTQVEQFDFIKYDVKDLCCGHDIINIIAIGMQHVFASSNAKDYPEEVIFRELLLAFTKEDFEFTNISQFFHNWKNIKDQELQTA